MKVGLYFCSCGKSYVSDLPYQQARCLTCGSNLEIELQPTRKQLTLLDDRQLEHLWKLFSKVQFDKNDEGITERFLIFLPTSNRFVVWLWFAERYSGPFADLPGKLTWQEKGRDREYECECGQHIAAGESCYINPRYRKVLCDACGKRDMMDLWLFEGYRNPWIRCADDPLFTRNSFHVVESVDELMEKFRQGNWCLGTAFVYKNLAFINQIDGGDEWMTLKDWCSFESITFRAVLRHGAHYTRQYIEELLHYEIDNRNSPDYTIVEALI
ncbi:hypothetical protein ACLBWT_18340 [Paenibacillus sp. D51F]